MSNIEKLLEGVEVEWKPLGEIIDTITAPTKVKKEAYCITGKMPIIDQGIEFIAGYTDKLLTPVSSGKYVIFGDHSEHIKYVDFAFIQGADGLKILKPKYDNAKYIYYAFVNFYQKELNYKRHWSTAKETLIPIPCPDNPEKSLEIQAEIVQILDKFSTLTAELQAELQARKSQYEYYRNQLLDYPMEESDQPSLRSSRSATSIKESDNPTQPQSAQNAHADNSVLPPRGKVQWKTLGEIGRFYGGITGKSKDDFTDGNAKFITYKNVYTNPSLNLDIKEKVRIYDGEKQHTLQYADIIFTGSSETPDECGLTSIVTEKIDEKLYLNSFCFFLRLFDTEIIIPTFAKHLFRSKNLRQQISKTASGVTRFNVSKKLMEKVLIPIPPIKEQERIASILDKFDTLTNSISEGLPKMIEQSQKQYEYYRDMLLTFPSLLAVSTSSLRAVSTSSLRAVSTSSLRAVLTPSLRAAGEAIQKNKHTKQ